MDKKKSIIIIIVSVTSRIILLLSAILVRRLLIHYIGNDVNGLNSLYTNIISTLAMAELGIGGAIAFSMYKPIVNGEKRKVAALYCLHKKIYRIIGIVIFLFGIIVTPFLPYFIKDYRSISVNVYISFILTLVSAVLSYFFGAKTSLIEAYKNNYITTGICFIGQILRYGLQIAVILIWKSYVIFLICHLIETIVIWLLTEVVVYKKYKDIVTLHEVVDPETKTEINRNVKAMMLHKIGIVMVSAIDNLIISIFIGVNILGKYSNYTLIIGVVASIIGLFFAPLTAVVGHLCAERNSVEIKKWFDHFYCLNFILGVIFFLGYYAIIDNVITICFGSELQMARTISFIITLNRFTLYMRSTGLLFRDASGTFYNDRWKPVIEGIINLILSLLFVNIFPEQYKVVGVIVATIITTLTICNTIEPYVVFKYVFKQSPKKFYIRNYSFTGVFMICLFLMNIFKQSFDNQIKELLVNGIIACGLSLIVFCLLSLIDKGFRFEVKTLIMKTSTWISRKTCLRQ